MKPVWNTVAAAFAAALLAGTAAAQEPIKIGVTQPLTGAFAASGNYVSQGAKIAEEAINAQGGVLGRKIQLVIEDNKSNPTEAVATAEKLISKDKVPVLMGAWSSTLTLAVMPKLMEYQVPMLVETSSSGKITTSGNPYIFRISPTSEMEAKAFAPLVKKFGIKKADFLATNNDFGLGASQEFSEDAEGAGRAGRRRGDHGPEGDRLLGAARQDQGLGRRHALRHHRGGAGHADPQQAKEQQVKARIITTGGSVSPDQLIAQAGDAANGSYPPGVLHAVVPRRGEEPRLAKKFVAEWTARKYEVGGLTEGFRGWDGVYTIVEAIKLPARPSRRRSRSAVEREGERHQRRHRLHQAGPGGQGERAERAERLRGEDRQRESSQAVV